VSALRSWRYALLNPVRHPDAGANAALLGPLTLGVEVTEPALAAACGLGNLDPQHGENSSGVAAITAALRWPIPPAGATLVTIRPDPDAFGAMAVLALRADGAAPGPAARTRIALVARWDAHDHGEWTKWREANPPLSRPADARRAAGAPLAVRALAVFAGDQALTPTARVGCMRRWIGEGLLPADATARAGAAWAATIAAWNDGEIEIVCGGDPRLVILRSRRPHALRLAYAHAPVVVAAGGARAGRKVTVAQFEPGWIDLAALRADLAAREPGWGGSPTIIGSPQGAPSALPIELVTDLARARLMSRSA